MAFRFHRKKNVNIMRVGVKIVTTVIGLWVSGYMLTIIGDIMKATCSPFYKGLTLIGWTMNSSAGSSSCTDCCVATTSGAGILSVVGLLAVVWVIFEFVDISY